MKDNNSEDEKLDSIIDELMKELELNPSKEPPKSPTEPLEDGFWPYDPNKESFSEYEARRKQFYGKPLSNENVEQVVSFLSNKLYATEYVLDVVEAVKSMDYYDILVDFTKQEELDILKNHLDSDDNILLPDFELVGTTLQMRKYEPLELTFICTSGKIAVRDRLETSIPDAVAEMLGTKGTIKEMRHYAKYNQINSYVGNSCPTLYWSEEKQMLSVNAERKYHKVTYDGREYEELSKELVDNSFKEVGFVVTDTWGCCVMDAEEYKKVATYPDDKHVQFIDLPKGVYKVKHYYGIVKVPQEDRYNQAYTTYERIGDLDYKNLKRIEKTEE